MNATKSKARLAGWLYLLVILFGVFAELYVRSSLIVPHAPEATVQNILTNSSLFRLGFLSDLMMQLAFFLLAFVLYSLFRGIDEKKAKFMLLSVVISVAIMCLNMLHQFAALLLLENPQLMIVFDIEQLHALVYFFLDLQKYGYRIAQLFFGLWLFPLGCLACESDFIPKTIGILLIISCLCFLVDFFLFFLLPGYSTDLSSIITLPTTIGEFSMCLWLLIGRVRPA